MPSTSAFVILNSVVENLTIFEDLGGVLLVRCSFVRSCRQDSKVKTKARVKVRSKDCETHRNCTLMEHRTECGKKGEDGPPSSFVILQNLSSNSNTGQVDHNNGSSSLRPEPVGIYDEIDPATNDTKRAISVQYGTLDSKSAKLAAEGVTENEVLRYHLLVAAQTTVAFYLQHVRRTQTYFVH